MKASRLVFGGDDLRHDRQRDLLRRGSANFQPDGRMQPRQRLLGDARLSQSLDALFVGALAAQHADVGGFRRQRGFQRRVIDFRIVGQQGEVGVAVHDDLRQRLVGEAVVDAVDIGEALVGGEGVTRVDQRHLEAERFGEALQGHGDMHAADHDQVRARRDHVDHDRVLAQRGTTRLRGDVAVDERADLLRRQPIIAVDDCAVGVERDFRARCFACEDGQRRERLIVLRGVRCELPPARVQRLHPDGDPATARQPHVPGAVVADAVMQQARLAVFQRRQRLLDDRALDAAAADRADHRHLRRDRHLRADATRRRPPGRHHRRQGDLLPLM